MNNFLRMLLRMRASVRECMCANTYGVNFTCNGAHTKSTRSHVSKVPPRMNNYMRMLLRMHASVRECKCARVHVHVTGVNFTCNGAHTKSTRSHVSKVPPRMLLFASSSSQYV